MFACKLLWCLCLGGLLVSFPSQTRAQTQTTQSPMASASLRLPFFSSSHPGQHHASAAPISAPHTTYNQLQRRTRLRGNTFGIHRRAVIDSGSVILSLPTLIIGLVPLLGNVVALSSGMGQFGWGLAGVGMSAVGVLLMIPVFGIPGVALALGIFQAALMGISATNLILGILQRRARQPNASAALSTNRPFSFTFGF